MITWYCATWCATGNVAARVACSCFATRVPHRVERMSAEPVGFDPSIASRGRSQSPGLAVPVDLGPESHVSSYSMHAATAKPEGSDLAFQSGHPPAYSNGAEGKKDAGDHNASMDPNLTGPRRSEGAQSGYPNVRQEQPAYRLDLLQTDPNLDSNASLPGDGAEAGMWHLLMQTTSRVPFPSSRTRWRRRRAMRARPFSHPTFPALARRLRQAPTKRVMQMRLPAPLAGQMQQMQRVCMVRRRADRRTIPSRRKRKRHPTAAAPACVLPIRLPSASVARR